MIGISEIKKHMVLEPCNEYTEQTKEYKLKDAISAFLLYVILLVELILMGKIFVDRGDALTQGFIFTVTGFYALSIISFVGLLCVIHKQKFSTIGFSKTYWIKSLKFGIILFLMILTWGILRILFFHGTVKTDISLILINIVYYLVFIGFMEEIVFRGYIGTRLYGFISNKKVSILITGIMFSLMHVPFQAMMAKVEPIEYLMTNFINIIIILIMHICFQWMYAKYNSIVAPTIFHFIWDFIQWIIN